MPKKKTPGGADPAGPALKKTKVTPSLAPASGAPAGIGSTPAPAAHAGAAAPTLAPASPAAPDTLSLAPSPPPAAAPAAGTLAATGAPSPAPAGSLDPAAAAAAPPAYTTQRDLTLTEDQGRTGIFVPPEDWKQEDGFRLDKPTPTLTDTKDSSSGYHEVVTTNTVNLLVHRKPAEGVAGKTVCPAPERSRHPLSGASVIEDQVKMVLAVADGFRTDTARTILSAPRGKPGGHTGNNLRRFRMPEAHDLLRKVVVDILLTKQDGMTTKSTAGLLAAVTVAMVAPGAVARLSEGGTWNLKDQGAKDPWESDRNRAKARSDALYDSLGDAEKKFVDLHFAKYLASVNMGAPAEAVRTADALKRHRTPYRLAEVLAATSGEVSGGGHAPAATVTMLDMSPPSDPAHWGHYVTEPFRALRRRPESLAPTPAPAAPVGLAPDLKPAPASSAPGLAAAPMPTGGPPADPTLSPAADDKAASSDAGAAKAAVDEIVEMAL